MSVILSAYDLGFSYGTEPVLQNVSFEVQAGMYIGIVGPNGSGKTTLLKTLLGFMQPSAGTASLFSKDSSTFRDWQRIGYLSQKASNFNPYFPATVEEVISWGIFPRSTQDHKKTEQIMERLAIKDLRKVLVGKLSGGQQQRVFLARALVNAPELLILDEPSTALDPASRNSFFELLRKINKEQGVTILLVTHDIGTIGEHATQLLYLDKRVIFFGAFQDFCGSKEMTEYFGSVAQHMICHQHH